MGRKISVSYTLSANTSLLNSQGGFAICNSIFSIKVALSDSLVENLLSKYPISGTFTLKMSQ